MTPSTIEYMEEAKLSGLPVIPFAYPTCVLVDRMKNKTKDNDPRLSFYELHSFMSATAKIHPYQVDTFS